MFAWRQVYGILGTHRLDQAWDEPAVGFSGAEEWEEAEPVPFDLVDFAETFDEIQTSQFCGGVSGFGIHRVGLVDHTLEIAVLRLRACSDEFFHAAGGGNIQ